MKVAGVGGERMDHSAFSACERTAIQNLSSLDPLSLCALLADFGRALPTSVVRCRLGRCLLCSSSPYLVVPAPFLPQWTGPQDKMLALAGVPVTILVPAGINSPVYLCVTVSWIWPIAPISRRNSTLSPLKIEHVDAKGLARLGGTRCPSAPLESKSPAHTSLSSAQPALQAQKQTA
ncbi:hypothetical protein AB1Y20_005026 [Prymnesium parvum]|uniref:Uncharacterized protein n=1 Tax=Prymnesium parvum TaxID=97485 RepID=A0AB34J252_PRYPA